MKHSTSKKISINWQKSADSVLETLPLESRRQYRAVCNRMLNLAGLRPVGSSKTISVPVKSLIVENVNEDTLVYILCNLIKTKILQLKVQLFVGKRKTPFLVKEVDESVDVENMSIGLLKEELLEHPKMEVFFKLDKINYINDKLDELGFRNGQRKPERLIDEIDGDFYFNGSKLEIKNKQTIGCRIIHVLIKYYGIRPDGISYNDLQQYLFREYEEKDYKEKHLRKLSKRIQNALTNEHQSFFYVAKIKNKFPNNKSKIVETRNGRVFFHNLPI